MKKNEGEKCEERIKEGREGNEIFHSSMERSLICSTVFDVNKENFFFFFNKNDLMLILFATLCFY